MPLPSIPTKQCCEPKSLSMHSIHPSFCPSTYPFIHPSSIHPSIHSGCFLDSFPFFLSVHQSIHPSILSVHHTFIHPRPFIHASIFIHSSVRSSTYSLSIHLAVRLINQSEIETRDREKEREREREKNTAVHCAIF